MDMHKLTVVELDIWGDEVDGFEVNNAFYTSYSLGVSEDCSDAKIIQGLIDIDYLSVDVTEDDVEIDGDPEHGLYINLAENGKPLIHLLPRY